jgi:hypothetical protein
MRRISVLTAFTVVFLLAAGLPAFADQLQVDGDVATVGAQSSVSLSAAPGESKSFPVDLVIDCQTKGHIESTVTLAYDAVESTVPSGGTLSASTAQITRPAGWPTDTNNCPNPSPTTAPARSTVTVTAPPTGGTYTYRVRWWSNDTDLNSNAKVDISLTVATPAPSDTTPPVIVSTVSGTAGTNGWYTSNVTVTWSVTDAQSGVTIDSGCGVQTFTNETAGTPSACSAHSAGGSASASVNVKLDKTAPSAGLSPAGTLGSNGWYTSDVTVTTAGTDTVSGPLTCTAPQLLTAETAGTTVQGSCTNNAGLSTTATPLSVKLDKTGPSAGLSVTSGTAGAGGWYTSDVTVHTAGGDLISGPVTCTEDAVLTTDTSGTPVNGSCTNAAGLSTAAAPLTVKLDKSDPTANLSVTAGTLGAAGWYTSAVTIHASGSDSVSEPVACTDDQFQAADTAGATFNGSCTNGAGRSHAAAPVTIKLDTTPPTAALEVVSGTPGTNGWYTSVVTVRAVGTDPTSGVTCSGDTTLTAETAGSVVTGWCRNEAGLQTPAAPMTIKIDMSGPTANLAVTAGTAGADGWYTSAVTVATTGADPISGLPLCTADQFQTAETAGSVFNGRCTNAAGISTDATALTVKLDLSAPTAELSVTQGTEGANDWYTSDVTVGTTGADDVSTITFCTGPQSLTEETAGTEVSGSCTNGAGLESPVAKLTVKIDKTAPTATASITGGTAGSAGWYTSDVTVHVSGSDLVSDGVVCTPDVVVSDETASRSVGGSCTNAAGLTRQAQALTIKLDKTPPSATLTPSGTQGANGWYTTNVTVATSGEDTISGPAICTTDQTLSSDTGGTEVHGSCTNEAGLSQDALPVVVKVDKSDPDASLSIEGTLGADGWYVSDVAVHASGGDNVSNPVACDPTDRSQTEDTAGIAFSSLCTNDAGRTQIAGPTTVKVDKTPPTARLEVVSGTEGTNGWYTSAVTVRTVGADGTSGVTCSTDQTFATDTTGTSVSGWCRNGAGQRTDADPLTLKIDRTAPTAGLQVTAGTPGANDWYTSAVTVHTDGADAISGVTCTADQSQSADTAGTDFNGSCTNGAGLTTNAASLTVKLDTTGPSTALSVTAGTPGANGWYTSDVTVHTSGADGMSGLATCTADQFQTAETTGNPFLGSCTNGAGLSTAAPARTVKLDKSVPTASLSVSSGTLGAHDWYTSTVVVGTHGQDSISGVAGCTGDQTFSAETTGVEVNGSCTNGAGLTGDAAPLGLKIDLSGPSASLAVTSGTVGANGWYTSDVTVAATGTDDISGPTVCTAVQKVENDTAGVELNGGCTNDAGIHTAAAPISVMLDESNPTASLSVTAGNLGQNGWYTSDVTVHTSGADNVSEPVACTDDQLQQAETTGEVFNGQCTNGAGLTQNASPLTVKVDKTPPTARLGVVSGTPGGGDWFTSAVTVRTVGEDGTSGVTCSAPQTLSTDTSGTVVEGSCTNGAGLITDAEPLTIRIDTTGPTATLSVSNGTPGAGGWYTSTVTVHTSGADPVSGGVVCTADQEQAAETTVAVFSGSCTNAAGITTAAGPLTVKVDTTGPTAALSASGTLGNDGWYTGDVTVSTNGSDTISGLISCTANQFQTTDTAGVTFTGSCINGAGLTTNATPLSVKRDGTDPVVTVTGLETTTEYVLGTGPALGCDTQDATSGVAAWATVVSVTGGNAAGVGTHVVTCDGARDAAGNVADPEVKNGYEVRYGWNGFLQPINDTAHQVGTNTSIFKAGSTVPVKLRLTRADGSAVVSPTAPRWLAPVKGSSTTALVDETVYTATSTSGDSYRWDASGQQYIYNWASPKNGAGSYYRIGVTLDDGMTYYVNIGLR